MSDIHKNGGPVFPVDAAMRDGYGQPIDFPGMSLRDWFAGQALQGILAGYWSNESLSGLSETVIAGEAYRAADAMLGARNPAMKGDETWTSNPDFKRCSTAP